MDETATTQDSPAWWENTLDFVVRAAAAKRFTSPQLQSGQSYYVDGNGNVLPMGQMVPGQPINTNAALGNPMVMLAGLAIGFLIIYKLVK